MGVFNNTASYSLSLENIDSASKKYTRSYSNANATIVNAAADSSNTETALEALNKIDNYMKALNAFSTNTYSDTKLKATVSINEYIVSMMEG